MKIDTHLLNMVRQILDCREKEDKLEERRVWDEAVKHIARKFSCGGISAAGELHKTLELFTDNSV